MNVLFVCHRLPFPPKRGGKIRPFNIIRHFKESGHRVTVATLARSEQELAEGSGLEAYCDRLLVGQIGKMGAIAQMVGRLPTLSPSSMGYFYSRGLQSKVGKLLSESQFDLIFVHCSSVAQYVNGAKGVPSIMDFGDMDSCKWHDYSSFKSFPVSLGYRLEAAKLGRAEKCLARQFSMSTCTTRAELDTLRSLEAAPESDWFPNGVDSEYFSPSDLDYDSDRICFIGRMDYYPNQQAMLSFCGNVLPIIQSRRPSTRLTIVGAEPSRDIRKLAEKPGITVTGTVPDVREYVQRAAVTVAPLIIARGTQNKILESMAMGVPVVSSRAAARGVDAIDGEQMLTADSPAEYAAAIIRLLSDREERARLANGGRQCVLANHSWPASMQKLDDIVARVTGCDA